MSNDVDVAIDNIKQESDVFTKAKLIELLLKKGEISLKNLSEKLGFKPSYICHIKRLNRLPDLIIDSYYSGVISISHLFVISRLPSQEKMTEIYEDVLKKNLTVSETENLIRQNLYGIKTSGKHINDQEKELLIEKIKNTFSGVDVKIIQTRIKGKLIFEIKNNLSVSTKTIKEIISKII